MNGNPPNSVFPPHSVLRRGFLEIIVCVLSALVYLPTLAFGFVYDDVPQILKNPAIRNWSYLPQYFTSHVWAAIYPNSAGNYYRPLFLMWLRLSYVLFGANPVGWHAACVLCHVGATYLVFRFTEKLTCDRGISFVAALLFGLHPAHIENVAWISGVTDPLMACFFLGSCLAFLRFLESRANLSLALSLAFFGLALLSKETAIVLPLLIFAISLVRLRSGISVGKNRSRISSATRETVAFVLLSLLYLGARYHAIRGFAHSTIPISWTDVFFTWPSVLWFYAKHLVLPIHISEFYSLDYVRHFSVGVFLLPIFLLLCLVLALGLALRHWVRLRSQKDICYLALALIVFPLLPVLDLRSLTAGDIVHDRYLYLPSVGFALLIAIFLSALRPRLPERRRFMAPAAVTGIVCLIYAVLVLTEQTQWANDIRLYTRGIESAPNNLTVRDNLANAYMNTNQPDRAIPLYLDVLKQNPNFWRSNYNLGFAYYKTGNANAAEAPLEHAILVDGSDSDQYIYLALVQLQLQKFTDASDNARRAIDRDPQAHGYHFILGLISEAQGDRNAASAAFATELKQHPDNSAAAEKLREVEGAAASFRR
jgi:protein O-mannosyl-transferase